MACTVSRHLRAASCVSSSCSYPTAVGRVVNRCRKTVLKATQTDVVDLSLLDGMYMTETFYDLLNVSPQADEKAIRRAYLGMMKECHPDRSNVEANEFCALLNEVYETLSDPQKRATYDALFGFTDDSINPFNDPAQELDQVFVDEFTCIGCRNCTNVCPSTFAIEEDWGRARVEVQGADPVPKQQEAIDTCPVNCIHWVSSQQLSLLEASMARMERISVWAMGNSSASNKDVFTEASIAWSKRFQALRQRRAAAAARNRAPGAGGPFGGWWGNVVPFEGSSQSTAYEANARQRARNEAANGSGNGSGDNGSSLGDKESRNIAALAARAARAARTWKIVQEVTVKTRSRGLQLSSMSSASSMDDV